MMLQEKLIQFRNLAKLEAIEKQQETLSRYESHLSEQLVQKKEQYHLERQKVYKDKLEQLDHFYQRELNQLEINHKQQLTLQKVHQEQLLLEEVKEQLLLFKQTESYRTLLKSEISYVIQLADMEYCKIYLDPSDCALLPYLTHQFPVKIVLSKHSILGGIYAKIPGKNLFVDETMSTKLSEARDAHLVQS